MNRFLASERSRAGLLIIAASLIGGTGCVTSMIVSEAHQKRMQKEYQAKEERENEAIRTAAQHGSVDAMTKLGYYEVVGRSRGIAADLKSGMALLEQAAARPFPPAEYWLGNLLVEGQYGVTPDPARGLELIKRSATHACKLDETGSIRPAAVLGFMFRVGARNVPSNRAEAELWLARSVVHCRDPYSHALQDAVYNVSEAERGPVTMMAWLLLAGKENALDAPVLSPEQRQLAEREARRLRQRVRDSEKQYPAPPKE